MAMATPFTPQVSRPLRHYYEATRSQPGSGLNFVKRSPRENTSHEVRFGVGVRVGVGVGVPHNRAYASSDGSNKPPMTVLYRVPSALPQLRHSKGFSSFGLSLFRSKVLLLDEPN
jgi:hypothetical protein